MNATTGATLLPPPPPRCNPTTQPEPVISITTTVMPQAAIYKLNEAANIRQKQLTGPPDDLPEWPIHKSNVEKLVADERSLGTPTVLAEAVGQCLLCRNRRDTTPHSRITMCIEAYERRGE